MEVLGERPDDHSRFAFDEAGPDIEALRYLGERVMRSMGVSRTNRRVMDRVVEIPAPVPFGKVSRSVDDPLARLKGRCGGGGHVLAGPPGPRSGAIAPRRRPPMPLQREMVRSLYFGRRQA